MDQKLNNTNASLLLYWLLPQKWKKKQQNLHQQTRQSKLSPGKIIPLTITIYHDREILQEATNILGQAFIQALLSAAILP